MRFLLLSPVGIIAVLGILWCARVLQSLPSDWQEFHETGDRNRKRGLIFVWMTALAAATITAIILYGLTVTSLDELESWKRF